MRTATSLVGPVGLLILTLSQVACGGQGAAISPDATSTAVQPSTPSLAPSRTASPKSRPTPSPTATSGPSVLGNLQVTFIPATTEVKAPSPPIEVGLVIKPAAGGAEVTQSIPEAGDGFSLTLDPGSYALSALEIRAPSMSDEAFQVPTAGPTFTVPASGCVYIGRISFAYYRMPEGSLEAQTEVIKAAFGRDDLYFVFLESGSLVGKEAGVTLPPEGERVTGSEKCSATPAEF